MLIDIDKLDHKLVTQLAQHRLNTIEKQRDSIESRRDKFEDEEVKLVFSCKGRQ